MGEVKQRYIANAFTEPWMDYVSGNYRLFLCIEDLCNSARERGNSSDNYLVRFLRSGTGALVELDDERHPNLRFQR